MHHSIRIALKLTSLSEADCLAGTENREYFSSLYNVNKLVIILLLRFWDVEVHTTCILCMGT